MPGRAELVPLLSGFGAFLNCMSCTIESSSAVGESQTALNRDQAWLDAMRDFHNRRARLAQPESTAD
jgi:hypothetical protein